MDRGVNVERTRSQIRQEMIKWEIDPSEYEIDWEYNPNNLREKCPGAIVRFMRNRVWQEISCYRFSSRSENLRQCYLLIERLRIAERHGVSYKGLTSSKAVAETKPANSMDEKQELQDAYDLLGCDSKDNVEMIKRVFQVKVQYVHPDKEGGDAERFKRLQHAYDLIMKSKGVGAAS
ncbi:MAG: hypothetical protein A2Y59_00560 [Chloroflexi bacterium RBG_13_52_14]|nr:MAG: hypothetical protein A2Y59_00560 [Chloroflexi bacterium RBG_13_52_14]